MTNYIEEMMKTAGCNQKITCTHVECPQFSIVKRDKCPAINNHPNEECLKYAKYTTAKRIYPDFTAEKQLEIIKLIASKETYSDEGVEFGMYQLNNSWGVELWVEGGYTAIEFKNKDFTQALAELVTKLMNAGELDKSKVKEILE